MNYLSICSGIESCSVAWEPLGWKPIGFSEIEEFRSAVLQYHYPEVKNYGDFTKITKETIGTKPDVLVGGTPCATFSIAGLRKGFAEDRGNLALEFIRLIDRVRPTWVVWENVPGILSSNEGKDLGTFLGALAELRYGFAYRVLDTQYVRTSRFPRAIPQRRRRIFVVGHIRDWRYPAKVLFDQEPMQENPYPSRTKKQRVAKESTNRIRRRGDYIEDDVSSTICARDYKSATDLVVEQDTYTRTGNFFGDGYKEDDKASTILARDYKDITDLVVVRDNHTKSNGKPWSEEDVSFTLTAGDIPAVTVLETSTPDKTARIYKDEVSPTLTAMTGGNRQPIVFLEKDNVNEENSLIHVGDIAEQVTVRKHKLDVQKIQKVLHEGKNNKNLTIKDIAETLKVNKTTVDHWFRTDNSFSVPDKEIWFAVKKLLQIKTDEFDKQITEFITKEGVFEMTRRVYSDKGVSPTITASNPEVKIATRNKSIRRLTPIECERLQGFPDNYTQVPYRGKPKEEAPVSKRYEACGRAMSINVMEWLGTRIQKVHESD